MANLDAEYDKQMMTFLLTMKKIIAKASPGNYNLQLQDLVEARMQLTQQLLQWPNGQPFDLEQLSRISGSLLRVKFRIPELERIVSDQTHIVERIQASSLRLLVRAPLLEVNDADSADFAKWMHDQRGWTGTACIDRALDADLRVDIVQHLDDVPYRMFERIGEEVVFEYLV